MMSLRRCISQNAKTDGKPLELCSEKIPSKLFKYYMLGYMVEN